MDMNNGSDIKPKLDRLSEESIIKAFRQLWGEHVMWTRLFIVSAIAGLDDVNFVTQRLLRQPIDFAVELRKYYGGQKAEIFEALFTDHLMILINLIHSLKDGNFQAADSDRERLYRNVNEIADFLSSINPYWNRETWQKMLYNHLEMAERIAEYRLTGQYAADIAEFDSALNQSLIMGNYMSEHIIEQLLSK